LGDPFLKDLSAKAASFCANKKFLLAGSNTYSTIYFTTYFTEYLQMKKILSFIMVLCFAVSVLISGCSGTEKLEDHTPSTQKAPETSGDTVNPGNSRTGSMEISENNEASEDDEEGTSKPGKAEKQAPQIDLAKIKPNEAGKIMVVMFHNFIETYESGDKEYTTTFSDFQKLLQTLYDEGYRLISVRDMINNNISVPAGCIPMVFTFDDGTSGQFNLVEENGRLIANKKSAVGIMEEFNSIHPDFGLKGTFYVNLGLGTFEGKGTVDERLNYIIDKGFDIGNHTYTHIMLNAVKDAAKIQQEIGLNQKKMYELVPGYKLESFSLPYGLPAKELQGFVAKGEFEGVKYENLTIMEVGWDPSVSPVSKNFNPLSVHRVRASGIEPVDADLAWWLKNLSRNEQYISDGNPDTVTIPKEKEPEVDEGKLKGKKLIVY
jgi:hypothetical protein